MGGWRWLIMWSASAHEAPYAAAVHRPAERSPSPPMHMGRDAICSASWSSSAVAWSLAQQCHRCPLRARVMCSSILAGELRWQCADYVVGTWTGALEKELPTTLQNRAREGLRPTIAARQ